MTDLQKLIVAYGDCREQIGWLTAYCERTSGQPRLEGLRRLGIRVNEAKELLGKLTAAEARAGL
jgi:hypothetical protein